jgi:hypothetical protein
MRTAPGPLNSPGAYFQSASTYGEVRSNLERAGTPIDPNDMLIAAQAIASGAILVTDSVSEFARVADLPIENWRDWQRDQIFYAHRARTSGLCPSSLDIPCRQ